MSASPGAHDGLIFDLDGTLWDSTETVAGAWTAVLRRMGQPERTVTPTDIAALMGRTHRDICHALLPGLPEPRQESLMLACYAAEESALHARGGRLYPGVREGLTALAARVPLFIVSNCQRGYIETFLAWSGLAALFRDHECHGNTGADKAENLRRVVGRNGLRAPLYVGDTEGDRQAAEAAALSFVHAAWGFGDAPQAAVRMADFTALTCWLEADERV
ncbi:MAG TPA: HAD family hydrolase [bacterium]|nr:HAD family hydrolase [bacterium]